MTKSVRLSTTARKRDTKALSCLIVTIWPLTLVFTVAPTCLKYERLFFFWESLKLVVFLIIRLVTSLSNAILPQLSQSSISRHNFSGTTAAVARLSISHFRKGLPCSLIMVMIFATFIKSRLPPMAVWWTELYIMVWIPAYSLNSCTILQRDGAIIKYFSRACSLPMIPMKPPFIFIFYVHVRCSDLDQITTIQKYPCFRVIVL